MSETKHTPLPWRWQFLPEDHGYETLIGTGGFRVLMHSGEYGPVKEQDQELIVTSVNARPQVEELVKMILFVYNNPGEAEGTAEEVREISDEIFDKARALESCLESGRQAALGGKAE